MRICICDAFRHGKQAVLRCVQDFMAFLMRLNTTALEPDDPMLTYVQSAGTRMCKCLGHEFVPLLPQFVPPLLESAGKKAELTVCARRRRRRRRHMYTLPLPPPLPHMLAGASDRWRSICWLRFGACQSAR